LVLLLIIQTSQEISMSGEQNTTNDSNRSQPGSGGVSSGDFTSMAMSAYAQYSKGVERQANRTGGGKDDQEQGGSATGDNVKSGGGGYEAFMTGCGGGKK
jgi:hypothetical protein